MLPFGSFLSQLPLIILAGLYLAWAGSFFVRKAEAVNDSHEIVVTEKESSGIQYITVNDLFTDPAVEPETRESLFIPIIESFLLPGNNLWGCKCCCHLTGSVLFSQPPPLKY